MIIQVLLNHFNKMTSLIILLLVGGALTGFLAGLLGIGGGIIIVPILAFVLHLFPHTSEYYMQFAAGSSLGIMIFTSFVSVKHKLKQKEISLQLASASKITFVRYLN